MKVKLKVVAGSHAGKEIAITSEKFLVGRSEACQLRSKSRSVSRKHCIIVLKENKVLIQDLNSRNGTFVNEKRLPLDKAKFLKAGDQLRIGKLNFELIIEHELEAAKKPEVSDVGDAAARIVPARSQDRHFEAVDVGSWLDEADPIDRVRKLSDTQTFQFTIDQAAGEDANEKSEAGDHDSDELSVSESEGSSVRQQKAKKKQQKPGKLPEEFKRSMTDNSCDAADNALRRLFTGR